MKRYVLVLIGFLYYSISFGQFFSGYKVIDEYEVSIGGLNVQGDFGIRGQFETTLSNIGTGVGAKMYFNFNDPYSELRSYFGKHLRSNLGFQMGYSVLSHNNDVYGPKINSLSGQVYYFALGLNMEYHLSDLRMINFFSSSFFTKFDPYIGAGGYGIYYGVDIESELGNFEKDPSILPECYRGRIKTGNRITPALHLEAGIRYRFTDDLQLSFKTEWMFLPDDYFDGLSPNPDLVKNLYNDWLAKTSAGIIIFIQ